MTGREVLISPECIDKPDDTGERLPVNLTKEEIKESPVLHEDEPISRAEEEQLVEYFDWTSYWNPTVYYPLRPLSLETVVAGERDSNLGEDEINTELKREGMIEGYDIQASDGEIGHLDSLIIDDESWLVRYLVVDTRDWLPGRKVVLAPEWIQEVDWARERIAVPLTRDEVKGAPEYDPDVRIDRVYEEKLYDYFEEDKYWELEEERTKGVGEEE